MRAISLLLLLVSVSLNLSAADKVATPEALVAELYKAHDAEKSPFFQDKDRALVDRYFTKELADLMWKDIKASKGEVGAIDFDPLYNAQDTEIKNFVINPAKVDGGKATVVMNFTNFDKKTRITFKLAQQGDAWKISDIQYPEGHALLKLYKDAAAN
ncbi:MAG: DUF3828 domain-containing protein [Prosthecobacter sp.]|uniref:DUF3828 domain-containing protein n=1 Tax=Prosthecobacter sp. TaxID=1965333 RepID=UPI003903FF48